MTDVQLSSSSTVFWRDVFPQIWTLGVGAGMAGIWFDAYGHSTSPELKILGGLMWFGTSLLMRLWSRSLKQVWLGENGLRVSDGETERLIPLTDVIKMSETRGQKIKSIKLTLRSGSPLGSAIRFIPPMEFQAPFSTHPSIQKIEERKRMMAAGAESQALALGRDSSHGPRG